MQNKPEYTRVLPHYHPIGGTFFITFRLHGSLPKVFLEELSRWYESEKSRIATLSPSEDQLREATLLQRDYFRKLDQGIDQCLCGPTFLKNPALARLVITQLTQFDSQFYHLLAYTIMPNHVHVLLDFSAQARPDGTYDPNKYKNVDYVMDRIKGASGRYINLALKQTGQPCWQPEYHDRYIRDPRHLLAAVDYIKQNVVSARICSHWREHPFTSVHDKFW